VSCIWKEIGAKCVKVPSFLCKSWRACSVLRAVQILFPKGLLPELALHPLAGGEMPCLKPGRALLQFGTWAFVVSGAHF